jgi:hypothetical protein
LKKQESAEQFRTPVLDSAVCTIFVHRLRGSGRSVVTFAYKAIINCVIVYQVQYQTTWNSFLIKGLGHEIEFNFFDKNEQF